MWTGTRENLFVEDAVPRSCKAKKMEVDIARKAALQHMAQKKPVGGVPSESRGTQYAFTPAEIKSIQEHAGPHENHKIMYDCECRYQNPNALTKRVSNDVPAGIEYRLRTDALIREEDEKNASRRALGGDLAGPEKNDPVHSPRLQLARLEQQCQSEAAAEQQAFHMAC